MGKTTILSYIIDAFHEIARPCFPQTFSGDKEKYYQISLPTRKTIKEQPSFIYLRFLTVNGQHIDYVNARCDRDGNCTLEQYNAAIKINDKISFEKISTQLNQDHNVKFVQGFGAPITKDIFDNNLLTYFPAYRYELPGYLNEPYQFKLNMERKFSGYLRNPLEVITGLQEFINWLLSVVLDVVNQDSLNQPNQNKNFTYLNLCRVLSEIIHSKFKTKSTRIIKDTIHPMFSFGVGARNQGISRITVRTTEDNPTFLYPTLGTLSSGESGLLCIFGELLRQADNIKLDMESENIQGIVLIDEIDQHLHPQLLSEALPKLLNMFPNVQFITSSHSPFLNMGLNEIVANRTKILSLPGGIQVPPLDDPQFKEAYQLMIKQEELTTTLQENSKPLILTEGKTDVMHLKKAMRMLKIEDLDIDFFPCGGKDRLNKLLNYAASTSGILTYNKIIVGIFDCDNEDSIEITEGNENKYTNYGKKVYAICIPPIYIYEHCSIEHYYPDGILKKENEGRRLFTGDEFDAEGNSKDGKYHCTYKPKKLKNKIVIKGIIDEEVYEKDKIERKINVACSKTDFAKLIENDDFIGDFDFESFLPIFEQLRTILSAAK